MSDPYWPAVAAQRRPGPVAHTLADMFAAAEGVTVRLDATEIRVRRARRA